MPAEKHYLAFVDSIAASPTVRLDLSGGTRGPFNLRGESRFDPPPLKRSIPSTLLADGGIPTSAAYDNRVIVLKLGIMDGGEFKAPDPAAASLQLLMRELDRPLNILRYQAGTSTPVFFRTYRSGPDSVDFDPVTREVTVTLLAEPFALGEEEVLSPVTVANDPALANGMVLDITAPKGDVETPLYLTVASGVIGTGRRVSAFATRRRGTVSATPLLLQAESMTLVNSSTLPGSDVTMSGGGNSYVRTGGVATNMLTRLQTATRFPSSASTDARGTYRVFCRCRQTVGTDVMAMRLLWGGTDVQVTNDTVTLPTDVGPGAVTIKLIDLGLVQIPVGFDPESRGLSGVEIAAEGLFVALQSQRLSGSGQLEFDYLLFLPADDRMMMVKWPESATVTDLVVEGGPTPAVYARNASAQITSTQAPQISGGGLMITPGRTNRVFFVRDVGIGTSLTGSGDSLVATTSLTPSYFPRYLSPARPVST